MGFFDNGYILVRDAISLEMCKFGYKFVLDWEIRQKVLQKVSSPIEFGVPTDDFFGCSSDSQVLGSMSLRGVPFFDSLMVYLMSTFEKSLNRKLVPNYSYCRLYRRGQVLDPHVDRKSCEVSVTLPLGFSDDFSDIWKIWLKENDTKIGVNLKPGMALLYKGDEVLHWRDELEYTDHVQLFLHYNFDSDESKIEYDNRPYHGLSYYLMGG